MRKAREALRRAIQAAGGQSALAVALGVRQSHIWHWLHKSQHGVPAERVADIERVTGIAREELRPDLYPERPAGSGFAENGIDGRAMPGGGAKAVPPERSDGHFSRFKHLRSAHFASGEAITAHIRALRDEWDRR